MWNGICANLKIKSYTLIENYSTKEYIYKVITWSNSGATITLKRFRVLRHTREFFTHEYGCHRLKFWLTLSTRRHFFKELLPSIWQWSCLFFLTTSVCRDRGSNPNLPHARSKTWITDTCEREVISTYTGTILYC